MFANTKKYKIGDREIICMDLTYGYLVGVESGSIIENQHSVVMDGTGLSEEEVFALRGSDVTAIYNVITQLTYPHAYNEDGTLKDISENDLDDSKKKV